MILITGATGKLGQHVVEQLLEKVPAKQIAVAVRNPEKASAWAARGIDVRQADYDKPESWARALSGVQQVLLISSNELGKRFKQHKVVVEAAHKAGVKLLAYTSLLRANTSKMTLAIEHRDTEEAIRKIGIPYVFLRNGWYFENHTENLQPALAHGAIAGSVRDGRIAAASRADYAAAAVAVLTGKGHEDKAYELAGDKAFSLPELAAEAARQSGKPVVYRDMPEAAYKEMLAGFGLPPALAGILADAEAHAAQGALDDRSGDLHRLIGRSTSTLADAVRAALKHG